MYSSKPVYRKPRRLTVYVTGTQQRVPDKYLKHRLKFKQIGKNVFVITAQPPFSPEITLEVFKQKFPKARTIGEAMDMVSKPVLVLANAEQVAEYRQLKADFDRYVLDIQFEEAGRAVADWSARLLQAQKSVVRLDNSLVRARNLQTRLRLQLGQDVE